MLDILAPHTVFVLIEARCASAGISPSETVLISGENNYVDGQAESDVSERRPGVDSDRLNIPLRELDEIMLK